MNVLPSDEWISRAIRFATAVTLIGLSMIVLAGGGAAMGLFIEWAWGIV